MRLRAVLLLALFLGAGTSLPSLDALLYHRHPDRAAGQTHFDPAGGCGGHADHCTLGRTPPGSRSVHPWTTETRLALNPISEPAPTEVARLHFAPHGSLPHSRAPPVMSV